MKFIYIILLIIIIYIFNIKSFTFANIFFCEIFMNVKIPYNNHKIKPFYFIHIPKNMGMNVFTSLPNKYFDKYFGCGYTKKNIFNLARSHFILNDIYEHYPECINIPKIAIIREPIDRFISICNFYRISPNFFIKVCNYNKNSKVTLPTIYNLLNFTKRQYEFIETNKNDNIILLDFKDKDKIYNTFKSFNVIIDIKTKKNKSKYIYIVKKI